MSLKVKIAVKSDKNNSLFVIIQLLDMLKFYANFEINDQTGESLTDRDMTKLHYDRIISLQKAAFVKYPDLKRFALTNVASVDTRGALIKHFENLKYFIHALTSENLNA